MNIRTSGSSILKSIGGIQRSGRPNKSLGRHKRYKVRVEIAAAFAIGVLLPVLETCRRGLCEWSVNFTTMFEDYLAGALLLVAGWASYRGRPFGAMFLVLAWAYVAGMMGGSFWGQFEETLRGTSTEPNNLLVVGFKGLLWSASVLSLVFSFQRASRERDA